MESLLTNLETYLQSSPLLSLAAAYLGGILVSLTPCVYPMLPITVGVISSANLGGSRLRGFILSLAYVSGLALAYAGLGLFAAATGSFFGTVNTNPYTFLLVGNILLFFGLSMLDVFQLPFLSAQITTRAKGIPGVFVIGMSSALVAGPCTAPALGSLLAFAGASGNLLTGGLLLFAFAFGMGSVLLAAGTFSGLLASIPRSGGWLEKIKKIIGLLMIGLAEYFFFQAGRLFL